MTILLPVLLCLFSVKSQTPWPNRRWFTLSPLVDGRIEAWIRGYGYPRPDGVAPYAFTYRNSIEIDPDNGQLFIAFGVSEANMAATGHIMGVTLESGQTDVGVPRNLTNADSIPWVDLPFTYQTDKFGEKWIQDNMILWYDRKMKCMIMLFQIFSDEKAGDENHKWQYVYKTASCRDRFEWSKPEMLLSGLIWPHVQYPLLESLSVGADGYPDRVILPIHHLDMETTNRSYQMVGLTTRELKPTMHTWEIKNMTHPLPPNKTDLDSFGGHIQASIVRLGNSPFLVSFMRDMNGYYVYRATSPDDGYTWSAPEQTPIPNPSLMLQAVMLHSGHILLLYNPQEYFGTTDVNNRPVNSHHLMAALSGDAGLTWFAAQPIEYAYDSIFLYPYAIQDPTCDNIYVTYSVQTDIGDQSCGAFFDFMGQRTTECASQTQDDGTVLWEDCDGYVKDESPLLFWSDDYKAQAAECFGNAWTESFIKFTVLHESWILDNHNWEYDSTGCTWEIPESLIGSQPAGFVTQAEADEITETSENYNLLIALLASAIILFLLLDILLICRRRQKRLESEMLANPNSVQAGFS